jgi:hypothetical protein
MFASTTSLSQAIACDTSPDLERIPGASDAEHESRYNAYERDYDVVRAFELERSSIENSWNVYLAKVESATKPTERVGVTELRVKPVWQVRGLLPAELKTVDEGPLNSCAYRNRDLRDTKIGDLIIVFESPGSVHGMRADEARSGELIDAISMYALSLRHLASPNQ